jgi:hypothetical protein
MYNNFYPFFLHFLSDLFEIRYQWSVRSAVKHSLVSRKSAKGRPYFSDGLKWNCFYACTIKRYDSLEQRIPWKILWCFTACTICSFDVRVTNSWYVCHPLNVAGNRLSLNGCRKALKQADKLFLSTSTSCSVKMSSKNISSETVLSYRASRALM